MQEGEKGERAGEGELAGGGCCVCERGVGGGFGDGTRINTVTWKEMKRESSREGTGTGSARRRDTVISCCCPLMRDLLWDGTGTRTMAGNWYRLIGHRRCSFRCAADAAPPFLLFKLETMGVK